MKNISWCAELTDTYGGQANYAWVRRLYFETAENMSDIAVIRKAKKLLDISKIRHKKQNWSDAADTIQLDLVGMNMVAFIYITETEVTQ
jgi:hypothetical protein